MQVWQYGGLSALALPPATILHNARLGILQVTALLG
jgi:hypothetical protein